MPIHIQLSASDFMRDDIVQFNRKVSFNENLLNTFPAYLVIILGNVHFDSKHSVLTFLLVDNAHDLFGNDYIFMDGSTWNKYCLEWRD